MVLMEVGLTIPSAAANSDPPPPLLQTPNPPSQIEGDLGQASLSPPAGPAPPVQRLSLVKHPAKGKPIGAPVLTALTLWAALPGSDLALVPPEAPATAGSAETSPAASPAADADPNARSQDLVSGALDPAPTEPLPLEGSAPVPEPAAGTSVGVPEFSLQAAALLQGGDLSARVRGGVIYTLSPSVFAGATVDLTGGNAFTDSAGTGISLNELYVTASPANLPELRFTLGLMDLTSYFDRNSFAKDAVTHFFNPVFQTNPALSAVNLSSRPGALVNWTPIDPVSLTAAAFSSSRSLGSLALDSFAGEVGVRFGNAILRGTYVTGRDAGYGSGFQEVFATPQPGGTGFGPQPGDREEAFGLNAEYFIPEIKLGLFGRYGWYNNLDLATGGSTYSLGANALDLFFPDDRLGLAYGRQLSNASAQQASGRPVPDVLELFYDLRLSPNLRAGVSVQERNAFTETYLGLRLRYDLADRDLRRIFE